MTARPTNVTETGLHTAVFELDAAVADGFVRLDTQIDAERRALARGAGLALGLGLVAGAGLGFCTALARRWKEGA